MSLDPARRLAMPLLLVALATATASARPAPPETPPTRKEAPPRHPRLYTVTQRLDPAPIQTFARLSPAQRRVLRELTSRSTIRTRVHAAGGRVLLSLSPRHPGGPMEILLCEETHRLVVFLPRPRLSFTLPLERLPDVLDGCPASRRDDFAVGADPAGDKEAAPVQPDATDWPWRTRVVDLPLSYRYFPRPGRPVSWPIRQPFSLTVLDAPRPFYSVFQQPLLHLALPALQSDSGVLVLEALAWRSGTPLSWSTTVRNEAKPGGAAPTFHATVDDHGWVRVAPGRLAATRDGYRKGRELTRALGKGAQIVPAARLAGLRSGRTTGSLTVNNRARHAALVYVDGFLLGWVGARSSFELKGLPDGYYRVYAVSPTGVRYWGPNDMYVPGPLTLR